MVEMLGQFGIEKAEALTLLRAQDVSMLRQRLKEGWHKLAFKLHPDRGGDGEAFKKLSALYDLLEKIQPVAVPVVQQSIFGPGVEVVTVSFDGSTIYHQGTWNSGTGYW
jgi:hypothetical protein